MKVTSVGVCLLAVLIPFSSLTADDLSRTSTLLLPVPPDGANKGGESSPFTVGTWKLVCNNGTACQDPIVDTEFRFINPTTLTVTLEYAFFENDGRFCGCDRDTLKPNQTTVYTVSGERNVNGLMQCTGSSGALKSIVFANQRNNAILIDEATQTGFQTHLFGNITTTADGATSYANTMGEAGMKGIAITQETLREINAIHQACVEFLNHR